VNFSLANESSLSSCDKPIPQNGQIRNTLGEQEKKVRRPAFEKEIFDAERKLKIAVAVTIRQ
jgi:hypothetical protein